MNISNSQINKSMTFKAKIRIAKCNIFDRQNRDFSQATMYEYDCKDIEDVIFFEQLEKESKWRFADIFSGKACCKHSGMYGNEKLYTLEDKNGITIGICNIQENINEACLKFIESNNGKQYRYVGQNMLAILAGKAFMFGKKTFKVQNALADALFFYKKCGFKLDNEAFGKSQIDLFMNRESMMKLIQTAQNKTNGKIINLYL